jgi:replicative DNA helicase
MIEQSGKNYASKRGSEQSSGGRVQAEAKLVSAVCKNGDISVLMADNVDELFTTHRDVWEYVKNHYFKYKAVPDIEEVVDKYRDFDGTDTTGPTKYYLDELRNVYIKAKIRNMFLDKGRKLDSLAGQEILDELWGEISDLGKLTQTVRDIDLTDYESAEEYFKAQAQRSERMGGTPGIPTGFKAIDASYATGMSPGHLIVLIGWSGRGKTWFSSYLACKAWEQGYKPMIMSLEMSPENMRDRIYTIMGAGTFKNSEFSNGSIDVDEFRRWSAKKFSQKNNFVIVSSEGADDITPHTVQAKIDQHRPDLVICDYHQLFDDNKHSRNEVERNRNISREFKLLAVRNDIPVVDLSQATQDDVSDTDEAPMIEQVAWSKGIQHDADLAVAVHKNADSNLFEIIGRKNRHGDMFAFHLDWDINNGIIEEVYPDA